MAEISISANRQCKLCGQFVLTNKRREEEKEGGGYCGKNDPDWYVHIDMIWSTPCPMWSPIHTCGDCGDEIPQDQFESMGDLCAKCEPSYYKESY